MTGQRCVNYALVGKKRGFQVFFRCFLQPQPPQSEKRHHHACALYTLRVLELPAHENLCVPT